MYEFKTDPWDHQRTALKKAWKKPGFAYLMEMGTGKSKVAIDEGCIYFESAMINAWVIMAPKGVYKNWVRVGGELDTHMPDRVREQSDIGIWEPGGGNKENQRQLNKLLNSDGKLKILVINTESVQRPGQARDFLIRFCTQYSPLFDLDEATFIKNHDASRTEFLVDEIAPLCSYKRIMTGSPVTKSPMDLYSMFAFLNQSILGHKSFYAFRARYAVTRKVDFGGKLKRPITQIVSFRNIDILKDRIEPFSYRVTKEECLDLPPKVYTRRDVELTKEQLVAYAQMKEEALAILDAGSEDESFVSSTAVITQMMFLSRIVCGHIKNDDGDAIEIKNNRIEAMLEAVSEVSGKVVIWSRFRYDIDKIVKALQKEYGTESTAEYHGGNTATRQEDVDRFLNDDQCRFMVSNTQAGGYGNTWIVADTVIYYSNDFDLEKRLQSEDRTHRGGQTKKVTYIDLISPGTIEEKIVQSLRNKIDIAALITGDNYREWLI